MLRVTKAARMLAMGWGESDVANAFGIKEQQLQNWLKADSLCATVKKKIRDGVLPISAAVKLANLSPEDQVSKLDEILSAGIKPTTLNVAHNTKKKDTGDLSESEEERSKLPKNMKSVKKMFQQLQTECKESSGWPEEIKEQRLQFLSTVLAWIDGARTDDKLVEKWNLVGHNLE